VVGSEGGSKYKNNKNPCFRGSKGKNTTPFTTPHPGFFEDLGAQ